MAVGGVPEIDRRHPLDACLAALEMHATVRPDQVAKR